MGMMLLFGITFNKCDCHRSHRARSHGESLFMYKNADCDWALQFLDLDLVDEQRRRHEGVVDELLSSTLKFLEHKQKARC